MTPPTSVPAQPAANPHQSPHKCPHGLRRLAYAWRYSWRGIGHALRHESAFRQEMAVAVVLVPGAFWLGRDWVEVALLVGSVVLVLVTELLNSAVEAVVDRVGLDYHELSGRAKDLGSAAVLLTLLLAGGVWLAALWQCLSPLL